VQTVGKGPHLDLGIPPVPKLRRLAVKDSVA
jgi:hypothetical protein